MPSRYGRPGNDQSERTKSPRASVNEKLWVEMIESRTQKENSTALEHAATEAASAGFRPRIDREYPLDQAIEAVRHFATSNPRGKVVINTSDAAW